MINSAILFDKKWSKTYDYHYQPINYKKLTKYISKLTNYISKDKINSYFIKFEERIWAIGTDLNNIYPSWKYNNIFGLIE